MTQIPLLCDLFFFNTESPDPPAHEDYLSTSSNETKKWNHVKRGKGQGKHPTKSYKFLVHQEGPLGAEIGTLGLIATTKLFQNFPDAGIGIPGSNHLLESSSKKSHILSRIVLHIFAYFAYFSHDFRGSAIT